jgi:hypothetical protein
METMMRDPLNESPEASEQPYAREQEMELLAGEMSGETAELMNSLKQHFNDSNEELANALGVRGTTVDRWFAGETRPNENTIMKARKLAMMRGVTDQETNG